MCLLNDNLKKKKKKTAYHLVRDGIKSVFPEYMKKAETAVERERASVPCGLSNRIEKGMGIFPSFIFF